METRLAGKDIIMLDREMMESVDWTATVLGRETNIVAIADAFNGEQYVIVPGGKYSGVKMIYPAKEFAGKVMIGAYSVFAMKTRIANTLVQGFNEYVEHLGIPSLSPIKSLYAKGGVFTIYYTEDGAIDRRDFYGDLDDLKDMMEYHAWYLSSRDGGYKEIEYIAETETGDVVCVLTKSDWMGYPLIIAPAMVSTDGMVTDNYGTPVGGDSLNTAVNRFNRDIFDSQKYGCKYGQIERVLSKDGREYNFSILSDEE